MTKDNINKPNPKHYKFELKNVPVIIDGEEKIIDSLQLETRYILRDLLNDANLTHEQAFWYGNIGKRYFRLCKKHDDPTTDIKKIIQEAAFLLSSILGKEHKAKLLDEKGNDLLNDSSILGKEHKAKLLDEKGNDLLNDKEEIAVFDKLNSLLTPQEKEFLKDRNISCVMIDGGEIFMSVISDFINKLGDEENGEN